MAVIAVTGTPGTGKTAVAMELAGMLGYRMIELNGLAEERGLYVGNDEERGSRIVDIDGLREETGNLEDTILVSHYSHDMACDIIVVLRAGPGELRKRLERRGWSEAKIEENLEAEIMEVILEEARQTGKRVLVADTTGKGPAEVAEYIASII